MRATSYVQTPAVAAMLAASGLIAGLAGCTPPGDDPRDDLELREGYVMADTTPPTLASFSFSPSSIDVNGGSQEVVFSARITDDLSGFNNACVYFRSPSQNQYRSACFNEWSRLSGTALDGVYEARATFPQFSEPGTWTVSNAYLQDLVTNSRDFDAASFQATGLPNSIQVVGPADTTPPTLALFSFSPSSIDVGGGSQEVVFSARITDDLSGFNNACVYFRSPSQNQYRSACFNEWSRLSGTALDGVYEARATFPQFSEPGTWTVSNAYLQDLVTNSRDFDAASFQATGLPNSIQVALGPALPTMSVTGMSVTEATGTNVNAVFTVTLAPPATGQVTVQYATANDTATSGQDYAARSGTLKFKPGVTVIQVPVTVKGDALYEPTERFFLNLTNPVGATLGTGQAAATILDNDPIPGLSISDTTVVETNSTGAKAAFTVTLANPSSRTITVVWATQDGTAITPGDYTAKSGTLTFTPGATSRTIQVPIRGDTTRELTESFVVRLSNATNAVIAKSDGTCTITDND